MALEFEKNNHWLRVGWLSIRVIDDRLDSAVKLLLNFPPLLFLQTPLFPYFRSPISCEVLI